jgi:hypothetical protein
MPASSELSYIGQIASSLCHVCAAAQVNQSRTATVQEALRYGTAHGGSIKPTVSRFGCLKTSWGTPAEGLGCRSQKRCRVGVACEREEELLREQIFQIRVHIASTSPFDGYPLTGPSAVARADSVPQRNPA